MTDIVKLPRDGAAYNCTFHSVWATGECGKVTTTGLSAKAYEEALLVKPKGVSFMRALCPIHAETVLGFIR